MYILMHKDKGILITFEPVTSLYNMEKIIIAIDGYSSTGKSSFAKAIASALGYTHLDSGAMYRAVTLFALESGLILEDGHINAEALENRISDISIRFVHNIHTNKSETWLNERNVEGQIRQPAVSNQVSAIAALPFVRAFVDRNLREMGAQKGIVMDGRDIGTAVFPHAELKIFMTASLDVRAQRRWKEMQEKGTPTSLQEVKENLEMRDRIDSTRATNPLAQAPDALLLDNGDMTPAQQMEWFFSIFEKRWGAVSR